MWFIQYFILLYGQNMFWWINCYLYYCQWIRFHDSVWWPGIFWIYQHLILSSLLDLVHQGYHFVITTWRWCCFLQLESWVHICYCHSANGWDPSIGLAVFTAVVRKGLIGQCNCSGNSLCSGYGAGLEGLQLEQC